MWVVAVGMGLALLYGIYPYNKDNAGVIEPAWLSDLHAAPFRTVGTVSRLDNLCLSHRLGR